MTAPDYDLAARIKRAGTAVGAENPQLATGLAMSDLSGYEMDMVGGFTRALGTAQLVKLSRLSGARTELSAEQRAQMDALGEDYVDVNDAPDKDDNRNWLEKAFGAVGGAFSNTGEFLLNNPVSDTVFGFFDFVNDVAHLPARLISSGIDTENDDEIDAQMQAQGYDPGNAWDYVQFMTMQGDSLFHDLDPLRGQYGDKLVDLAIEQMRDPEGFATAILTKDPEAQELVRSADFAKVADLVDRAHISPGRDVARLLLPKDMEDGAAFTAISGSLDLAYTVLLDPTLVVGKGVKVARGLDYLGDSTRQLSALDRLRPSQGVGRMIDVATNRRLRSGLRDALDQEGVRGLLAVDAEGRAVTRVGEGFQRFIDQTKAFTEAKDEGEKAIIFARLQSEHRQLMPLFDEVRGHRVILPHRPADAPAEPGLMDELLDEKGVKDALEGRGLDNTEREWLTGWARLSAKQGSKKIKLADQPASRRAALAPARMHLGRDADIDDAIINDTSRGSAARFEAALIKAFDSTPRRGATAVDEAPVPLITDAAPPIDGKLIDATGQGHFYTNGPSMWEEAAEKGVTPLEVFADYFADTAGMLRLAGGAAARREVMLPGRVALRQRVAGWNAGRRQARAQRVETYDHSRPFSILPDEVEESFQKALDDIEQLQASGAIDASQAARRGEAIYDEIKGQAGLIRKQRAKWEQRARRISSVLPTVNTLDLTDVTSIETVRRVARMYMSKGEADRLTSVYAAGDLGRRRQVAQGIIEQTLHAAGLGRSEAGLKQIEKFRADQLNLDKRAYGLSRTDVITTEAGERHVALLPSQLSDRMLLPDFRSLQYMATKFATGGRLARLGHLRSILTAEGMDAFMGAIKMGWITSPAGGFRNALDEIGGMLAQGRGLEMAKGKALFNDASKKAKAGDPEKAARLQSRLLWRIPAALRGLSRTTDQVFTAIGLGKLLHYKPDFDERELRYAGELVEDIKADLIADHITGTYYGDDLRKFGNDGAIDAANNGLVSKQVRHNGDLVKYDFDGYKQVEVDGGVGLDAFVDNLGLAFQDPTSPAHVALKALLEGRDGIADIVSYLQTPVMRHFVANAEIFKVTKNGVPVQSTEQLQDALENYAERLLAHVTMLVSGKGALLSEADEAAGAAARWENDITTPEWWKDPKHTVGPINEDLAEALLKGEIPDRNWIKENLAEEEIPSHVISKVFVPVNPTHKAGQLVQGYTAMLAKAYDTLVTKQVRWLSRNPMMTAAYVQARKNTESYVDFLVERGMARENAEQIARRVARSHAEQLVIKSIDDPTVSTQYAVLARNFHAFARAQEDWLRRWGRMIREDPTTIRRAQLALHGGESAGIVEKDSEGNLIFTYPGSGVVIDTFNNVMSKFGLAERVSVPVVPDLQSQLIYTNPSLDNPVGFSATPVISIPFDIIASTVGADYPLITASMDQALNGELGAGRDWLEKILPGWAQRIYNGVIKDEDPASQFASAYTQALMNMEAAGALDDLDGSDPTAMAKFQADLRSQIQNQMIARAMFGFFAPAAPGMPTNDVADAEGNPVLTADWAFHKAGIESLKEEARVVFNTLPYDKALEWWAANHPGELIYKQGGAGSRTVVGDSDASASASMAAAKYIQDHSYLFDKYGRKGGLAAYFIPQGVPDTPSGDFSQVAYRSQLESGMREYKSLEEFFEQIVTQRGEAIYFDTKDDYDAAITAANAAGNAYEADRLTEEWSVLKQRILATNPLMAAKFAEYASSGVAKDRTVAQLNEMLNDPKAVAEIGSQAGGVAELLLSQRNYEAALASVKGERGYMATSTREEAKRNFDAAIADITARFPGLADLARGTFRIA